ncbi:MAG: iron-sulfur cluster repair di-iron protein [Acidobacteria bacterium]|nr:iron-sulfur cluster repair di-iron protein [Acidobacteriota bacterium]
MNINAETPVREIAASHPAAVKILERAAIDYCCAGTRKLKDACEGGSARVEEVLAQLAALETEADNTAGNWTAASLGELIRHIVDRHHVYVREESPRVQAFIEKVLARHGEGHPELAEVRQQFAELRTDLAHHMLKEEQVLFPYVERMEKSVREGNGVPPPFFGTVRNPVQAMIAEHDQAGDILKSLRKLTNGFAPPEGACPTYCAMLAALREFEGDLHQHIHLENNILFPRAVRMEQEGS